jgi:hypothetical protein
MGEQPKPVDDDVERALASMRAGFLAGSEQIAAHIASLDAHLIDAPGEERDAVHAQVARLVASHDRITAKVMSAPASSWDSFKVMVNAVKQQQTVLDQVSHLVREHVLPRQIESLPITPFPATPPPEEAPPPPPLPHAEGFRSGEAPFRASDIFRPGDNAGAGVAARADAGFPPGEGVHPEALTIPRSRPPARRPSRAPPRARSEAGFRALAAAGLRTRDDDADVDETERRSLLALVRERTAGFRGLAAMIIVGIILSVLPRERLHEVGARLLEIVGPAVPETALDDRPPEPPVPPVAPRSAERVPSAADEDAPSSVPEPKTEPKARTEPKPKAEPRPKAESKPKTATSAPAPQKKPAAESAEAPRKLAEKADEAPVIAPRKQADKAEEAPVVPPPKHVAATKPDADTAAPPAPAEERFVPVVFTHKDHATVLRALADLKQQFPSVLIGLEGEVQPVDLGTKGVWHRLVFLPAGPRPQATRICDQLAAKGYDRCWVKAY